MQRCPLLLALAILLGLGLLLAPGEGKAAGIAAAVGGGAYSVMSPQPVGLRVFHNRKVYSTYCYPKKLWWFYRPYTTAMDDSYERCMPYFHYPEGPPLRGSRSAGALK